MELSSFTGIAAAVSVIIGLAFALGSRKKGGPKKVKELYDQLLVIGLDTFIPEEGIQERNGIKPPFRREASRNNHTLYPRRICSRLWK